jgi:hypothetical protein
MIYVVGALEAARREAVGACIHAYASAEPAHKWSDGQIGVKYKPFQPRCGSGGGKWEWFQEAKSDLR